MRGLGWTYGSAAAAQVVSGMLPDLLTRRAALDVPAAWHAMVRAVRNVGRPGIASCAISAVDFALWDLAARLLDVPLCRLLGQVRDAVPVYGSGGFTTYDDDRLRDQLTGWADGGFRQVKMKIGESWGSQVQRDLDRVCTALEAVGTKTELFVDANGGYPLGEALRVGRRLDELGVTWFEEPVSSDDVAGLARLRAALDLDVAAGEYIYRLADARLLCSGHGGGPAVDCLQIDATRCGGFTEWRRIAALAEENGLEVSGHCAPSLHCHVAAATPHLRHVEWFHDHVRIEQMLLDGAPAAAGGEIRPDLGRAGHGLTLRADDAERFRTRPGD
jgi:L-alanine-DL-glutamate epimerase-like enolase superfamily enzyme